MIRRNVVVVVFVVATVVLAALVPGCEPGAGRWTAPRVVKFRTEGEPQWMPLTLEYGPIQVSPRENAWAPLLLRDGDIVQGKPAENDGPLMLVYRDTDGDEVVVSGQGGRALIGGKTVLLVLSGKEEMKGNWEWLESAPDADLAALRMVYMEGELPPKAVASIDRLAKHNPKVGLMLDQGKSTEEILPKFQPRVLLFQGANFSAAAIEALATRRGTETLMLNGMETAPDAPKPDVAFLARMTDVRTLIIGGWDPAVEPPMPVIPQVRRLIAINFKGKDLTCLDRFTGLVEVALPLAGDLVDLGVLATLPQLRGISLMGCVEVTDLSPLAELKNLRWLSLPPKTTQEQLVKIIEDHPDLEVLQLIGCEGVTDLTPVTRLKNLKALAVFGNLPLEPLYGMKHLKALCVGRKEKSKEGEPDTFNAELLRLEEALPDTAVGRVMGMCMGSGWILLIVPAAGAAWLITRRLTRRRAAA